MRELVLYIAASLDGYIADRHGSVSFLDPYTDDGSYIRFLQTVDTLIMGGRTYRQVTEELSPERWPYPDRKCYVYSRQHSGTGQNGDVEFTKLPPLVLLELIQREYSNDTWLVGGGETIRDFLRYDLIDRMIIQQAPVLLGGGIPLFPAGDYQANFEPISVSAQAGGLTELIYTRKR